MRRGGEAEEEGDRIVVDDFWKERGMGVMMIEARGLVMAVTIMMMMALIMTKWLQ